MAELLPDRDADVSPCDHLVQVYRDRVELAEATALFLSSGLAVGESAVVIATPAHWPVIVERLARRGWDADALGEAGRLLVGDAEATLAAISDEAGPSSSRFTAVVGALLDRAAAASSSGRVRVFGEMVDVLCRRGRPEAADALEQMWNRLGARRRFVLLCGYRIDVFDREAQVSVLPRVYRAHSEALPAGDAERLDRAVDDALVTTFGPADAQKVRDQVARHAPGTQLPRGQHALMWLSANMPRSADRVLAAARANYLAAAGPAA